MNAGSNIPLTVKCTVMGLELAIVIQERSLNYDFAQDKNLEVKWNNAEGLNANNIIMVVLTI